MISPFAYIKIPDRQIIEMLKALSKVLNEHNDNDTLIKDKKLKRLARSYNKLVKRLSTKYEHDFPIYSL